MLLFLELNKDLDVDMFYIEEMKGHQVLCQWNLLIYFRWTAYRGRKAFIILLPYNLLGNKPHSIGLQGCQVFICELFLFSWIPQWVKITYPQKCSFGIPLSNNTMKWMATSCIGPLSSYAKSDLCIYSLLLFF